MESTDLVRVLLKRGCNDKRSMKSESTWKPSLKTMSIPMTQTLTRNSIKCSRKTSRGELQGMMKTIWLDIIVSLKSDPCRG